jgi:hypothetical protein
MKWTMPAPGRIESIAKAERFWPPDGRPIQNEYDYTYSKRSL